MNRPRTCSVGGPDMRPALTLLFVIGGLLAQGCDSGASSGSADDEPSSAPSPDGRGGACDAIVARVEREMDREATQVLFDPLGAVPVAEGGEALASTTLPRVELTEEELRLDGVPIESGEALARALETRRATWRTVHQGQPWPEAVLLHVRSGTPARRLAVLPPGLRYDLLVQDGAVTARPSPEPPGWMRARLSAVESEDRRDARLTEIRAILDRATGDCEPARAVAPSLDPRPGTGPAPQLPLGARSVPSLPRALEQCGCEGVDGDALLALLAWAHPIRRPVRRISFRWGEHGASLDPDVRLDDLVAELASTPSPRTLQRPEP